MASLRACLAFALAAAAVEVSACSQSSDSNAPPIDSVACEDAGPKCGTGANTTSNPKSEAGVDADAAGDADAAALETTTLSLSVGVFDTLFSDQTATPFKSTGFLSVPTLSGQKDYGIDADAGAGVVVEGVLVGDGWFQVRPTTNTDLYTTHSLLTVSKTDPVLFVPVVDRVQLGIIFNATPLTSPIEQNAGQIIAIFVDDLGSRVSGVRVSTSPFASDGLLYDSGPGAFQTDSGSSKTGSAGIVIFTNVTSGLGAFAYDYQDKTYASPAVTWVLGQATVVRVHVPKP